MHRDTTATGAGLVRTLLADPASAAQQRFREGVGADDAAWARGRGVVVHQAVQALPYYWDADPAMVAQASRALAAAVAQTA